MYAFTSSGTLLWTVPNDTPQIATSDGGVIGSSGGEYDQYGNADGQTEIPSPSPGQSSPGWWPNWSGMSYSVTNSSNVQYEYLFSNLATGYASVAGANPSGTGTALLNIETDEGIPQWRYPLGSRDVPACLLVGANKVELGLGVRTPYNEEIALLYEEAKASLLSRGYLASLGCKALFTQNPNLAPFFNQLTSAISNQKAYDGLQSNISKYDAGVWAQQFLTIPGELEELRVTPVCWEFNRILGPWTGILAMAQFQPPKTDVYIWTGKENLSLLKQSTLLHEALHSLTGMGDATLYFVLTGKPLGRQPTHVISTFLANNGCAAN